MNKKHLPDPYRSEDFNEYLRRLGHSPKTRKKEVREAAHFTAWLLKENIPLREAGHNDIMAYISQCAKAGNSPRTLALKVNEIKHYYAFLCHEKEMTERSGAEHGTQWQRMTEGSNNPASNIKIKGTKRRLLYRTFTPEELEGIYRTYRDTVPEPNAPVSVRNLCIVELLVRQGLTGGEIGRLTVEDLRLREGKIHIPGGRRSNERTLSLDAGQTYTLSEYVNGPRREILAHIGKQTQLLFPYAGKGESFQNVITEICDHIRKTNPAFTNIKQIKASVISNLLKVHDIRKVQYMAGHRYVSSTERYKANNTEELAADIQRFHPLG